MNYTDPSGHWSLGFWSKKQHYFAFNQNAPQKYAGYNDLYDMMDWTVGDLVTKKHKLHIGDYNFGKENMVHHIFQQLQMVVKLDCIIEIIKNQHIGIAHIHKIEE